jgi:choline dehydrogenase-like flavoprotein
MTADVCIIGAGAAGAVMSLELGRAGIKTIVLESGPRHDFARRGEYVRQYLQHRNPWRSRLERQDAFTIGGRVAYDLAGRRTRGVGGSTLHWEGYALRFHASDFALRSAHGIADDWPITYDDIEPYYARAEAALGVAGSPDDPFASRRSGPFPLPAFPFSYTDGMFARACSTVGIAFHHLPQARNSVPYGGRPQCSACSTCHVCPTGAKASTDLTHVPAAETTGNVRVVTEATVLRLQLARSGEVGEAVYARADRLEQRVTARIFVLAAGAVENARLLLLSSSRAFPDGLANGSGAVGKYFMSQPSVDALGRVEHNVYPYRVGFSTAMSRQFAARANRQRQGAFLLEFLNSAGGTPGELAGRSRLTGEALRRHVRSEFGRRIAIRIYSEQLPDRANSITLDPRFTDHFANPVPRVTYSPGRYDDAALDQGKRVARTILEAAGATDIGFTVMSPSGHQIGTHRMGSDPATSVVDRNLRAHDVANLYLVGSGAFVTSSASPPTLTIVALAIRAAEHIAARLRPASGGGEPGLHAGRLVQRAERLEDRQRLLEQFPGR